MQKKVVSLTDVHHRLGAVLREMGETNILEIRNGRESNRLIGYLVPPGKLTTFQRFKNLQDESDPDEPRTIVTTITIIIVS